MAFDKARPKREKKKELKLWQTIGDVAKGTAEGILAFAGEGVLYVATELVFALSGDTFVTDLQDYEMDNDCRDKRKPRRSKAKSKSRNPNPKRKGNEKPVIEADVKLYQAVEGRDEESEHAYKVVDLISKFNGAAGSGSTTPSNSSSNQEFKNAPSSKKSQEIFRPRTNSERPFGDMDQYAYLGPGQLQQMHIISEAMSPVKAFLPLAPFKDLHHQANRTPLFDDNSLNVSDDEALPSETEAMDAKTINTPNSKGTEIVDIRSEIEVIHRIIARFEAERVERKTLEDKSPTRSTEIPMKKDPKRTSEIRELISRLERLSIRHEELKARQIANTAARDPPAGNPVMVTSQ